MTHCWAVAEGPEGGWIVATTDGGNTWTEQYFQATAGFFQVKMLNAREGWAVGGIYKEYVAGLTEQKRGREWAAKRGPG